MASVAGATRDRCEVSQKMAPAYSAWRHVKDLLDDVFRWDEGQDRGVCPDAQEPGRQAAARRAEDPAGHERQSAQQHQHRDHIDPVDRGGEAGR
jgi:hypothetical protein